MNDIKTIDDLRAYHERLKAMLEALDELHNSTQFQPSIDGVNTRVAENLPFPSFIRAPMATTVPSEESETL